ncbi:MAG: hypothetical protein JWO36_5927 [Myxococcales bacterium]|nr:hypothetical protein [Myxococcales bacterium]
MRLATAALAFLLPSVASAGPWSAGISVGRTQSKIDANADANPTIGFFGRLAFTPRVAGQLDVQRIQTDDQSTDIRSATGLLAVDLGAGKHLVPMILAGFGIDKASSSYGYDTSATHLEGGFALEYRADGGLTIGLDLRMGGRSIQQNPQIQLATGTSALYVPSTLHEGEYRSGRLTVGIRF